MNRKVDAQENASEDRVEEEGQQPMRPESSSGIPDSPPLHSITALFLVFEKNCAPTRARTLDLGRSDHLSYDQLRDLCKQHGNDCKGAKENLKTRLVSMQDQQASSNQNLPTDVDTPATGAGKRGRPPADVVANFGGPHVCTG